MILGFLSVSSVSYAFIVHCMGGYRLFGIDGEVCIAVVFLHRICMGCCVDGWLTKLYYRSAPLLQRIVEIYR
jgi:hypothetical protein